MYDADFLNPHIICGSTGTYSRVDGGRGFIQGNRHILDEGTVQL